MDVSGQLYAPAAFSGGEKAHVPSGKETEWAQQPGCGPARNRTPIPTFSSL